jgi:hypothetical protein
MAMIDISRDSVRLETTWLGGEVWSQHPEPLENPWPFFPAHEANPQDGDVYTLQRDHTLWMWHTSQWIGPFADLDTAMIAARMSA